MSRSHSRDRDRKRKRSRSPERRSRSSSLSSTPHRRLKKEKKGKRRDETSAERAARKERKREKKARKEEKRKKKEGGGGWGNIFEKEAEFRLWLVEEHFINPETLPKAKEKELFRTFVEDFNTATLPHSKADEEALRKSFRRERKEEDSFVLFRSLNGFLPVSVQLSPSGLSFISPPEMSVHSSGTTSQKRVEMKAVLSV
ncbi:hypothetical protein BT69DRAFT_1280861 [Atractiella rhizophila]|nr:hypothetical protein BT69DRAFT_1280861 [Atractiella rhizophila]